MPERIALILGFLPGWEGRDIHTTAGHKTSRELITLWPLPNNLATQLAIPLPPLLELTTHQWLHRSRLLAGISALLHLVRGELRSSPHYCEEEFIQRTAEIGHL